MHRCIAVHPSFDAVWPFAADHFHSLWQQQGDVQFIRLRPGDQRRLGEIVSHPEQITQLVSLHVRVTRQCLEQFSELREAVLQPGLSGDVAELAKERGLRLYHHPTEGFWGESVAEYGLALTLCGLRRIPQLHHAILTSHEPWNYNSKQSLPGQRGAQFGDDPNFSNGTVRGKRVRIVGIGNIGSRYASFVRMLGADVAAWDPFAQDPCFHRAGARKEWHLNKLVKDADIFAPMLPLRDSTRGIVTRQHIESLPTGCLVVLVTRAAICDVEAIRERVLADELALAADVFDREPLPLDDPLLGRHNVVHSPHNAGRTEDANRQWSEQLAAQFLP